MSFWQDRVTAGAPALFDHAGRVPWRYQPHDRSARAYAADLDGDGLVELIVGDYRSGNITLLDHEGKQIWQQPAPDLHEVAAADIDGDGHAEIVRYRRGRTVDHS